MHSQKIRFNLIRQRGMSSSNTTLQQFKSFATVLRNSEPAVVFLPRLAYKQHYSSLHSVKQIQEVEANRMFQYFKPYYNKQNLLSQQVLPHEL